MSTQSLKVEVPTYELRDWDSDPLRVRITVSMYVGLVATFFLAAVCCVTIYLGFRNGSIDCSSTGQSKLFIWILVATLALQVGVTVWNTAEMAKFQSRRCLVPSEKQ